MSAGLARLLASFAACSLVTASAGREQAIPTVDQLVSKVATSWESLDVALTATMTVVQDNGRTSVSELLIRRAGRGRTRVDFLSPPKDQGKVILELEQETWLYLPRTGRTVQVPTKRNPLAGGVLFEDLFPGRPETADTVVEVEDDAYVLVTTTSGEKKGSSHVYFDRVTLMPVKREIYGSSGRLLKSVHIEKARTWRGSSLPWSVLFVDHLPRGAQVRIEVVAAEELGPRTDELFAKDRIAMGRP